MRVLALDTTTRAGSVAVVDDGRVLVERSGDAARSHAERLPTEVLDALSSLGWSTADIDLFAVASGPGSFTGLRIGIATIQGLALVHGRRTVPISALRALAALAAIGQPGGALVGAWMDAHRHDVFSALYEVVQPGIASSAILEERDGPTVGPPSRVLERWGGLGHPRAIAGDGATMYATLLPADVSVVPHAPLAGVIGQLALATESSGSPVLPASVQPLYVRRPDVEVTRDAARLRS